MIRRYSLPEMEKVWSSDFRFEQLLRVEKAVALAQGELGIIPKNAAKDIQKKAKFSVARIQEIEAVTKHDVIAFVSCVAENVGLSGRYVHYALTSSDVLDTAMSLVVKEAHRVLEIGLDKFETALQSLSQKHKNTLCAGRTHGMHAEPTTFGFKMASFLCELRRNRSRLNRAVQDFQIIKLSGPVGTYSNGMKKVEAIVGRRLTLVPETVATQVVPRDRHADVILALAMFGSGIERLAVELRHLQRTELGEAIEGFGAGQKGSSAMPHKKNPISAENLTGLARLLRSYAVPALEDVALWHERDISHSSVERVIFPDAFIVADYAAHRMAQLLEGLEVNETRMKANMDMSQGQLFSSQLLSHIVSHGGISREDAYKLVQGLSHSLTAKDQLRSKALVSTELLKHLNTKAIDDIFSGKEHLKYISDIVGQLTKTGAKTAAKTKAVAKRRAGHHNEH